MSRLLVLGVGQLGLMMAAAGARLGISVDRLDPETSEVIPGSSNCRVPLELDTLLERYPVISAEVEHLPDNDLVAAIRSSSRWVNRAAFETLPDRANQKALLDQLDLPTASWRLIESTRDIDEFACAHRGGLVLKTTRHGYDGKGQWRGFSSSEIALPQAHLRHVIAEPHVDFSRELSVIGVRSAEGALYFYPLTENYHRGGILRFSIAPAGGFEALQKSAEALLTRIMEHLDYVGVMAVECFHTASGLLVNEVAPRVHNSGHWTQLGTLHDQFSTHVRALSALPIVSSQRSHPTLMLNLIGCGFDRAWLELDGLQCHWYGKERRPGRKLGHINLDLTDAALADNAERLSGLLDDTHRGLLGAALTRARESGVID